MELLSSYRPDSTSGKTFASGAGTVATLIVWALAQSRGDGHRSLVTPKRELSEYNEDLIMIFFYYHPSLRIEQVTYIC